MRALRTTLAAALALGLAPTAARAGGLSRPNGISARGVGMGGAWAAWADDATALYFNPAGLADADPQVDVGGELVFGPRTYTPIAADGTRGAAQKATLLSPAPVLGALGRFTDDDGRPSRFTFAAGAWNTFGGKVSFPHTGMPAFDSSEDVSFEGTVGGAVRISDRLAVGAALRVALGLFSVDAFQDPFDAKLSASGAGVAFAAGATFRPTPAVRVAVSYRSTLRIDTTGSGTVLQPSGMTTQESVDHQQNWPQSATLGLGWQAAPRVKLSAQVDWTQWSQVDQIRVSVTHEPDQIFQESWRDTWTARLGGEYQAAPAVAVRAGAYVDTNAVPDRALERQYLDTTKLGLAAGASYALGAWRFDAAVDVVLAAQRTVTDNSDETSDFPADRNKAPGEYRGTLATLEVGVGYRF